MTDVEKLIERLTKGRSANEFVSEELAHEAAAMLRSLAGEIADYERGSQIDHETIRSLAAKERAACDYILELTNNQIGCGDDPIMFLIASHAALRAKLKAYDPSKYDVQVLLDKAAYAEEENTNLRAKLDEAEKALKLKDHLHYGASVSWSNAQDEIASLRAKLEGLREAAQALLDDVHRRYPGEALRCPYMIALEAEAADART